MSNELFVELNDEQQEVVAGGLASLALLNITAFSQDTVLGTSGSMATPVGAVAQSGGGAQSTDSLGISGLLAIAN
jgi:hypothetical protein